MLGSNVTVGADQVGNRLSRVPAGVGIFSLFPSSSYFSLSLGYFSRCIVTFVYMFYCALCHCAGVPVCRSAGVPVSRCADEPTYS